MAIITPKTMSLKRIFGETFKFIFFQIRNTKTKKIAKSILNQTKGKASNEIKAPKIAVNPHIKTMS